MKTSPQRKSANYLTLIVAASVADLLWIPMVARGQALTGTSLLVTGSTTLQGNVSVAGADSVVDFYGNSLYLGTSISGTTTQPGISALYTDGTPSRLSLLSARSSHQWYWGYLQSSGSSAPLMTLDPTSGLTIYDTSGNSIVLSPNTASGSGPSTLLTQQVADSRYVSSADFVVGSETMPWGETVPTIALNGGISTGGYSFAGINATASGWGSTASGFSSNAGGVFSNASGVFSNASGGYSTASGYSSTASGAYSTASGPYSNANGAYSNASGAHSNASGAHSNASGAYSNASGGYSTASGAYSTASGPFSTASGCGSTANGFSSNASGYGTNAAVYGEFVTGQNNISQGDSGEWVPTDELFVIGNGADSSHLSNALVVKKNGDTTVYGKLTVSGTSGSTAATPYGFSIAYDDGTSGTNSAVTLQSSRPSTAWNWQRVLTSGTAAPAMQLDASNRLILTGTAATNPPQIVLDPNSTSGSNSILTQQVADSRYVSSADIVVGSGTGNWMTGPTIALAGGTASGAYSFAGIRATASGFRSNASGFCSIVSGDRSTASGYCSSASGYCSTASGYLSNVSGSYSTASGYSSNASGNRSTASGHSSTASGSRSTASGYGSIASGQGSTASGYRSTASSFFSTASGAFTTAAVYGEFVVGQYNISQGDPDNWVPTDELFTIGNGVDDSHHSNAFVVKKNGDTTINGVLIVTGTAVPVTLTSGTTATKIVASGSNQSVLVPEQGDLSMGDFINGAKPQ